MAESRCWSGSRTPGVTQARLSAQAPGRSPDLLSDATSGFIECELIRSDAVGVIMSQAVDTIGTDKAGSDAARGCWLWGGPPPAAPSDPAVGFQR